MRNLSLFLIAVMFASVLLAGCLVRTGPNRHRGHSHAKQRRADCPPAHHWNGYRCVHNSNRGKGKGRRR